jgi:hypothetical protein
MSVAQEEQPTSAVVPIQPGLGDEYGKRGE